MPNAPDTFGCFENKMITSSGRYFDLLNPEPEMVWGKDIAASLSKICRFGGHSPRFYSVAEHSVLAANVAKSRGCEYEAVKAVLLHDAAEAYIGDVIRPLARFLTGIQDIKQVVEAVIADRFGVDFSAHHETIKMCDQIMLKAEKKALFPDDDCEWTGLNEVEDCDVKFRFFGPAGAGSEFAYQFFRAFTKDVPKPFWP